MTQCTWKGCAELGAHPQMDRFDREWAVLCQAHRDEYDRAVGVALKDSNPRSLMRAWVLAGNGHEAHERFREAVVKGAVALGQVAQQLRRKK